MNTPKPNNALFYAIMLAIYCLIVTGIFFGVGVLSHSNTVNNARRAVTSVKINAPPAANR
jgi:hypothetical protein